MGWETKPKKLIGCAIFREPFHAATITLLSLLLPLSFLLLARLSSYNYMLTITSDPIQQSPSFSFILSLLLSINPLILYFLVSIVSTATLIHGLTGKITLLSETPGVIYRPGLYTAWIVLCTLQTCVGLGIEGSMTAGIFDGSGFGSQRGFLCRYIFFLGLHETMIHWSRTVVKPVVDDTIFGEAVDEKWLQRVCMALSYGTLWWLRLRDEAESLVFMAEVKIEQSMDLGVADLLGWWLYYLTVTVGMVRVVKILIWLWLTLICKRVGRNSTETCEDEFDKRSELDLV